MSEPRLKAKTDLDVGRGRDASATIADMVMAKRCQGHDVLSVTVSRKVADAMKAYFASFTRGDGILPKHCHGVPFYIDLSADEDYVIRSKPKAN